MKHALKFLALIMSVFMIGVLLEETIDASKSNISESLEETFEIISELFSVFVALSIFGITWFANSKTRDRHSLFLGATFLTTGILIMFHLLSYPFMPDFINPNSSHKATIFFLESRFILAVLILASVFVHKDSLPKLINKRFMVLLITAILSVFLATGIFHEDFFGANNLDGYSMATALLLIVITIIILAACYLYEKIAKETGQINIYLIIYGSIIILFSNLVYFSYEFSGHFLIIAGFSYFYLALYESSIEIPYEKLALAEEKLRIGAENKYRNLFDNANDAIITTDLQDCITSWNRSAEKLFGWEGKGVMGQKLSDLFLMGQSESGIETVHIQDTGAQIFVSLTISQLLDSNNKLTGLSFIIHDITQHKKAEDLLIKSKEFTETVINSMNDAISVIDVNDFRIIEANSVFLDRHGLNKEDVIGKTCYEISHKRSQPCTSQDDNCPHVNTLNTGKLSTCVHVHHNKEGEMRYYEVSTSPIKDENGKIDKVIHVSRDITERKKTEKLIQDSLYEKETLLREIHHRVKNNMQIISSLLLLQSENIIDQKYLDIFNDSNNRVLSMALIHEKLYQSESLSQINIHEYINDLASNLMGSYGSKGNAELEINVENIPININYAVPCGLILNELITNSFKYAFPGDRHGKIKITFEKGDSNMIHFSVSDDGIGIPGELDIRNTKSLGMHLITALAENQLHGEIILNRERGTEFKINFRSD